MDGPSIPRTGLRALRAALLTLLTLAGAATAHASDRTEAGAAVRNADKVRGWTVHVDNDLFAFGNEDRDYTAGVSVAFAGRAKGLARALDWIDARARPNAPDIHGARADAFEIGLLLFTPHDLEAAEPLTDDRPYANLTYIAGSKLVRDPADRVAHQSSLTVGFLGLPFAEHLHRSTHDALGLDEPMGYAHQISDGGEPTFRYALSRLRLLAEGRIKEHPYDLRLGLTGSVGYLTEANAELAFRWGDLDSAWWSTMPSAAEYAGQPPVHGAARDTRSDRMRLQLSAGVTLRGRLYNSFLQGQFRDSDVTYSSSELNHVLVEAWLGLTTVLKNGLSVSYTVRHQTEELRVGRGEREFTWASIGVAQQF